MQRFGLLVLTGLGFISLIVFAWGISQGRSADSESMLLPTLASLNNAIKLADTLTPMPTTNHQAAATPAASVTFTPTATDTLASTQQQTQIASLSFPTLSNTYTVQSGESLVSIAMRYGISVQAFNAANGITDPVQVAAGQVLIIPSREVAAVSTNVPLYPTPKPLKDGLQSGAPLLLSTIMAAPSLTPLPKRPTDVNGVPMASIIVMPDDVIHNIRAIYILGKSFHRDAHAFSKLGDSIIENPFFLARFDGGEYNLGDYAYLQAVINDYKGSFGRDSIAVKRGMHSWSVFDPMWANKSFCQPNENVLACEIRVHNPSIILIRLGSNDVGIPKSFDANMRQIVDYAIKQGVIPVLCTKADRHEGSNINNDIIRQIALDYHVPLWDFDAVASTVPGKGLEADGTHLTTFYAHDYRQPVGFTRGHGLNNLTALIVLDAIERAVRK
jgi:LysM repeat protein